MPKLAIIAALPRELVLLVRDLAATTVSRQDGILIHAASPPDTASTILLITAGMGPGRVSLAVAAALSQGPIDILLSVGLAGACDPNLTSGTVLEATIVIDSRSGERFQTDTHLVADPKLGWGAPGILVTSPGIAGPAEKRRLRATYNAASVDMEAATVARLARAHGIPFGALKAISDEHDIDLTPLSTFADARGHFRTGAFALHTALRPHRWRPTATLGRNTRLALQSLTAAVQQRIAMYLAPEHP